MFKDTQAGWGDSNDPAGTYRGDDGLLAAKEGPSYEFWVGMLAALCDDMTFGIAIVNRYREFLYVNLAAKQSLAEADGVYESDRYLRAYVPEEEMELARCVEEASQGRRNWHVFQGPQRRFHIAFVPLWDKGREVVTGVALVFERPAVCNGISQHFFALANGLTATEERMTGELCRVPDVADAADSLDITISTARTHIKSILHKTGAPNLRALLLRLGMLPPISSSVELVSRHGEESAPLERAL